MEFTRRGGNNRFLTGHSTSNIKAAALKFNLNLKSLTGTNSGDAGVNHGDNEAAAATADSVDSIVSPNECGDINLDEGHAGVPRKGMGRGAV